MVETLIRCRILHHLIWVCTICQLPSYGSPNYKGLTDTAINNVALVNQQHVNNITGLGHLKIHIECQAQFLADYSTIALIGIQKVAQLDVPSDWRPGGRGFNPPLTGRQHSFVEIDYEIFTIVILSLPLIKEGHLSVSGERMCTILVNRLED